MKAIQSAVMEYVVLVTSGSSYVVMMVLYRCWGFYCYNLNQIYNLRLANVMRRHCTIYCDSAINGGDRRYV